MIKSEFLDNKLEANGKTDLFSNRLRINRDNIVVLEYIRVDDMSEMRLDVISKVVYGNHDQVKMLALFNEIDNPLQLAAGTIIACPDPSSFNANTIIDNYADIVKPSAVSKFSFDKKKDIATTPSEVAATKKSFTSRNGVLRF